MTKFMMTLCAAAAFLLSTPTYADATLAVMANRGELAAIKKWTALSEYLSEKTGEKITLVPLPASRVLPAAAAGRYDFYLVNPTQSVIGAELHGNKLMATLRKKTGTEFAGLIITTPDTGIKTAADLKGKHILALKIGSAAGAWMFQSYHLLENGIDPYNDVTLEEVKTQDDLALTVQAGFADAGYVRTGLLEGMAKRGDIEMSDFVIVDRVDDAELGMPRTTKKYPEWYMAAAKNADTALIAKVTKALFELQASDVAAQKAKIEGFSQPVDPTALLKAMKALKVGPFK